MHINVKYDTKSEWVTTTWIDFCDHAGAEMQNVDFGFPDREKADWVDDWQYVLICDKCGELVE